MENVKITGEVTISVQEYLDLRVDRGEAPACRELCQDRRGFEQGDIIRPV